MVIKNQKIIVLFKLAGLIDLRFKIYKGNHYKCNICQESNVTDFCKICETLNENKNNFYLK